MTAVGDVRAPEPRPQNARDLVKPALRGVIHQWSALAALLAAFVLVALPQPPGVRVGSAIYGVTIIGLFSVSAMYHRVTWTSQWARTVMRRADHSMIFLFIAGTYTPICLASLHGDRRVLFLILVWLGALGGVITSTAAPHAPRWVTVPLYIALGWVAVFVLPDILHRGGVAALVLLVAGGVIYSVGAVAYGTRRPNPLPLTFGYHEVFHSCTVIAAVCHYITVALIVLR